MNLSDLAAIGSFVSGVAVVFSFVFLGFQIRQANLNQKSLMQQGRSSRTAELLSDMTAPHISEIVVRAEKLDTTLQAQDIQAYFRLCAAWFFNYEDSFMQHQAGTLDPSIWEIDRTALRNLATNSGFRIAWRFVRNFSSGAFRGYVDNLMREAKADQTFDYLAAWRAGVAEELAGTKPELPAGDFSERG
jgi:hypothetical protein